MIAVKGTTSARPHGAVPEAMAYGGLGRPSVPRYRTAPASLRQLAIAHADQVQPVTWRQGTKETKGNPGAAMTSWFLAIRVRARQPPHPPALVTAACQSAGCWPNGHPKPMSLQTTGCLTCQKTLPPRSSVRLARSAADRDDYRELKRGLGLDHFEGRSFTGWHRHVTLAALAQAFATMIRTDPKAPAPG